MYSRTFRVNSLSQRAHLRSAYLRIVRVFLAVIVFPSFLPLSCGTSAQIHTADSKLQIEHTASITASTGHEMPEIYRSGHLTLISRHLYK